MLKAIITGASGFVGQNLSGYLMEKKVDVQKLSLRKESWQSKTDFRAIAIIHLAGKAHDTANTSTPEEYFKVNRDLAIALFDKFLTSETRDFFYFSSVKAVADKVEGVLTEEVEGKPLTPYGQSKLQAEQYLLEQPLPEGKRLFIIRPCMIHGPGNKGNLNLLYKVVEKGIPWPLASFDNNRSFLSIDNLSFLVLSMLQNKDIPGGIYNFSDDDALSTVELVSLISGTLGKKPKLWHINRRAVEKMARIGDKIKLSLNSERLKKLTENYIVSNQKIKTALNIKKLPLTTKEGLIKTFESFKIEN